MLGVPGLIDSSRHVNPLLMGVNTGPVNNKGGKDLSHFSAAGPVAVAWRRWWGRSLLWGVYLCGHAACGAARSVPEEPVPVTCALTAAPSVAGDAAEVLFHA